MWHFVGVGRTALFNRAAVEELTARQSGLITRSQALSCAITEEALRRRIRDAGPWQVLLPGVYLVTTGAATPDQREMAALLYAGPGSVLTGQAAMAAHGINVQDRTVVDVLMPAERKRRDHSFVHVLRTSKMPGVVYKTGELRYVPPARAVADAARQLSDIREVRTIVAAAIQRRSMSVADLADEIRTGPAAGSARVRAVLGEAAAGIRSSAEGDLLKLIRSSDLPEPLYNPALYLGDEFIAIPDAWWPDVGVAVEIDSRQWHLSPADWERTMARHSRMSALGIIVLHYPPRRMHVEPRVVVAEIRSTLESARDRPLLPFRAVPAC
jgi:hypothetical protein